MGWTLRFAEPPLVPTFSSLHISQALQVVMLPQTSEARGVGTSDELTASQ